MKHACICEAVIVHTAPREGGQFPRLSRTQGGARAPPSGLPKTSKGLRTAAVAEVDGGTTSPRRRRALGEMESAKSTLEADFQRAKKKLKRCGKGE